MRSRVLTVFVLFSVLDACCHAESVSRETPLVRAVKQSRQSVVNIHTEKKVAADKESRFLSPKSRKVTGMGTGVVIDERGYIVTNYHVIQDVDVITVSLDGGSTYEARPISFDRKHDLAIIRITADMPLTVMPMGTSSDLMLAETVYAVGNAFGYEHTITAGIISALHRDVEVDETQSYENLIQTDASINPGNSGGPLLNLNGEVIGINVAIRSGAQRIGFAIPIDDARKTIARLLSVEKLDGIPHGLVVSDIKTASEKKLVVDSVITGSAAEMCGIRSGDVICNVRGVEIRDCTDLERSLLTLPRGKVIDVRVMRDGREQTLPFTVGVGRHSVAAANPASITDQTVLPPVESGVVVSTPKATETKTVEVPARPVSQSASADAEVLNRVWNLVGLRLEPLTDSEKREVTNRTFPGPRGQVRYNGGMKITAVNAEKSVAATVREGDILLGLDGLETLSTGHLNFILRDTRIQGRSEIKCQIMRRGSNPQEVPLSITR